MIRALPPRYAPAGLAPDGPPECRRCRMCGWSPSHRGHRQYWPIDEAPAQLGDACLLRAIRASPPLTAELRHRSASLPQDHRFTVTSLESPNHVTRTVCGSTHPMRRSGKESHKGRIPFHQCER